MQMVVYVVLVNRTMQAICYIGVCMYDIYIWPKNWQHLCTIICQMYGIMPRIVAMYCLCACCTKYLLVPDTGMPVCKCVCRCMQACCRTGQVSARVCPSKLQQLVSYQRVR